MSAPDLDPSHLYPIRITGPAAEDIVQAAAFLSGLSGQEVADAWEDVFYHAERESRLLGLALRILLYEHRPAGAVYRVYFTIADTPDDPPFVRILRVRHAARRPLSPAEARQRLRAPDETP